MDLGPSTRVTEVGLTGTSQGSSALSRRVSCVKMDLELSTRVTVDLGLVGCCQGSSASSSSMAMHASASAQTLPLTCTRTCRVPRLAASSAVGWLCPAVTGWRPNSSQTSPRFSTWPVNQRTSPSLMTASGLTPSFPASSSCPACCMRTRYRPGRSRNPDSPTLLFTALLCGMTRAPTRSSPPPLDGPLPPPGSNRGEKARMYARPESATGTP
mmetsp:Transcript_84289/g.233616  ORF Transcript_84289/g.233616 Transcript_84289/m.233616 type:complete len:213 (-) Transcript_84289:626-1264(-)